MGLHYFSPVDKMPLAEIIPHAGTSAETVATTLAFARAQGKTPIVVKDEAGSMSTASWLPYMNRRRAWCWKGSRWRYWTALCSTSVSRSGAHHPAGRGGDRRGAKISPSSKKSWVASSSRRKGL